MPARNMPRWQHEPLQPKLHFCSAKCNNPSQFIAVTHDRKPDVLRVARPASAVSAELCQLRKLSNKHQKNLCPWAVLCKVLHHFRRCLQDLGGNLLSPMQ
jgi:hypothetical protein